MGRLLQHAPLSATIVIFRPPPLPETLSTHKTPAAISDEYEHLEVRGGPALPNV